MIHRCRITEKQKQI